MLSLTAFVVASSMVIGQAEVKAAMSAGLRAQIETHLIGNSILQTTFGDEKFSGEECWKWASDGSSIVIEGFSILDGKKSPYTCLAGWDVDRKELSIAGFAPAGDAWITRWTEFSPGGWKGHIAGTFRGEKYEAPAKIEFLKDSVRYEDTTAGKPWVTIGKRSQDVSSGDAEKAFTSFAELAVGGAWIADVDGKQFESKYESILDGKFLLFTGKAADVFPGSVSIVGVDPATKQFTSWGVDGKGGVSIERTKLASEGVWTNEYSLLGPSRSESSKSRLTKIDQDTVKFEVLEWTLNGKPQPVGPVSLYKRQR